MLCLLPILSAFLAETGCDFEFDYLSAMGNIFSRCETLAEAMGDGVYGGWGGGAWPTSPRWC